MKFLVPNYSYLQNPCLRGYRPQIPLLSVLNWICWNPPPSPEKNSWLRHWFQLVMLRNLWMYRRGTRCFSDGHKRKRVHLGVYRGRTCDIATVNNALLNGAEFNIRIIVRNNKCNRSNGVAVPKVYLPISFINRHTLRRMDACMCSSTCS